MEKVLISIVVPVYSGEKYLERLAAEIEKVKTGWVADKKPFEVIELVFVNDQCVDNSAAIMEKLKLTYPWISVVTLSRNFGQHQATAAGCLYTSGDFVVTLDEDLQHHPVHIESFLRLIADKGSDIIYARASGGAHKSFFRDMSSSLYKHIMYIITGNIYIRNFNSFRFIRGPLARAAASVMKHEGYFDVLLTWYTNSIVSIELEMRDERYILEKKSGYSLSKLIRHAKKLFLTSHPKILNSGFYLGILSVLVSIVYSANIIYEKISDSIPAQGWASSMIAILFFGGFSLFMLGILIKYISILLLHTHGKPAFFVIDRSKDSILKKYFNT